MIVSTIEDVMSQLLDRESSVFSASKQVATGAFGAKRGDNTNKEPSDRDSSNVILRSPARGGKLLNFQRSQRYLL